jgi:hypothetical protein
MATGFVIHTVDFGNTPSAVQDFSFYYKLWSDPDSSYILISASEPVNTNGTLQASPPLTVTGLVAGNLYYLKAVNNCDSAVDFFVKQVQL